MSSTQVPRACQCLVIAQYNRQLTQQRDLHADQLASSAYACARLPAKVIRLPGLVVTPKYAHIVGCPKISLADWVQSKSRAPDLAIGLLAAWRGSLQRRNSGED